MDTADLQIILLAITLLFMANDCLTLEKYIVLQIIQSLCSV